VLVNKEVGLGFKLFLIVSGLLAVACPPISCQHVPSRRVCSRNATLNLLLRRPRCSFRSFQALPGHGALAFSQEPLFYASGSCHFEDEGSSFRRWPPGPPAPIPRIPRSLPRSCLHRRGGWKSVLPRMREPAIPDTEETPPLSRRPMRRMARATWQVVASWLSRRARSVVLLNLLTFIFGTDVRHPAFLGCTSSV
jgi:hypothetical protein